MKKGEKLEKMIKEKYLAWSLSRFAEHAGIKKTTLHDITKKESLDKVAIENIQAIAKALDMSIEELLFRLDNDVSVSKKITYINPDSSDKTMMKEPCYDYLVDESEKYQIYLNQTDKHSMSNLNFYGPVSAGSPESVDCIIETEAEQIKLPKIFLGKFSNRKDIFVMKINGDSMNKILPPNSLILCVPISSVSELKPRDIVVFDYNNETSVKRFRETDTQVIFSPESTNENHFDKVIDKNTISEVKIIAKVVSYYVILD